MNSVGIIGFGRFGKVLSNILQKGFKIKAYDPNPIIEFPGVEFVDQKIQPSFLEDYYYL